MQPPAAAAMVPLKYMAKDPVTHRKPLSKKLRLKMKELKKDIRLRGLCVLHCVAVCGNVLQRGVVCCCVLQCVACVVVCVGKRRSSRK